MRTRELKIGKVYFVRFEHPDYPKDIHYVGPAKLVAIDNTATPFSMHHMIDPDGEDCWFGPRDIKGEMKLRYSFPKVKV